MNKRKVTQYDVEFKKSSARLAVDGTKSLSQTAKDLGINVSTLHGWVQKYYPNASFNKLAPSDAGLHEEIKSLRKQVIRLTQERDILKKASAYFAQEIR